MAIANVNIEKLLEIASPPFCDLLPGGDTLPSGTGGEELLSLLKMRNGFVAFEGALRFFPLCEGQSVPYDMEFWNSDDAWRTSYGDMASGLWFFAENAVGEQYAIDTEKGGIVSFEPETGERKPMAEDMEGWADTVLDDWQYVTMHPLVSKWQQINGPLSFKETLVPKRLFVTGGAYEAENLYAVDSVGSINFRGDIALQIKELPGGAKIRIRVIE